MQIIYYRRKRRRW